MGTHPVGDGVSWDDIEAIDADQPHGLDQRAITHLAKAIRKRNDKEHVAFGDTTAGGEHKPGGCAVIGMDITDDCTAGVAADGTYVGKGVVWALSDASNWGVLFCATGDGTAPTGDWTVMRIHPDHQWGGGDITWTGAHEFDTSVDISGNVTIEGDLTLEGKLLIDSSADFSDVFVEGDLSIAGTLKVATDFTLTGDMAVDGTTNFYDEVDFSSANLSGIAGLFGTDNTEDSDNASLAEDVTYQVSSDGLVIVSVCAPSSTIQFGIFVDTTAGMDAASEKGSSYISHGPHVLASTITVPVHKDGFWCITLGAGQIKSCTWQPIGDGSCDKNI